MTSEYPPGQNVVFRADFSSDEAWKEVTDLIEKHRGPAEFTLVDDRSHDGLTREGIIRLAESAGMTDLDYAFIADARAMNDSDHSLLVVDLEYNDPSFRVAPEFIRSVADNLTVSNLDFEDFNEGVDEDGVYRGN
ncbi:DUF6924 domain-containing protein [Gordonia humi]|uniref:DUF6924 domain-containing protein n=1 Tax=Gordonia humi TaxID=686429 RepID=A0A840EZ45_9ACTN|nr:hypothetical protein [Gordonia humi]MBB4135594.1 hypothetical protein [Gordonia humi]